MNVAKDHRSPTVAAASLTGHCSTGGEDGLAQGPDDLGAVETDDSLGSVTSAATSLLWPGPQPRSNASRGRRGADRFRKSRAAGSEDTSGERQPLRREIAVSEAVVGRSAHD